MTYEEKLKLVKKMIWEANFPNVHAVGIGDKIKKGKKTGELSIIVFVTNKLSERNIPEDDVIPYIFEIEDEEIKTDVVETPVFNAFAGSKSLKSRVRPIKPGYSIGHPNISCGTLGVFVRNRKNGEACGLSNNHVLADSNNANVGDEIWQPGSYDDGTGEDVVGFLEKFHKIEMASSNCWFSRLLTKALNGLWKLFGRKTRFYTAVEFYNKVDCAIFNLIVKIDEQIYRIGKPTGIKEAEVDAKVQKAGRTSGYTKGEVVAVDVIANVSYGVDGYALFDEQIASDMKCEGGDSGSAVLDMEGNLVGLLFAGGGGTTLINKIQNVFEALDLELLSDR